MTFDYHTHTTFSHGKGSIEDNVKVAISKGLKALARILYKQLAGL